MSATARDLLKTRPARVGEVYGLNHLKAGQANSQLVSFGGDLAVGTTPAKFKVSDTEAVLAQAIVKKSAEDEIAVASGATTDASSYRKVLIEMNASGTISQKVGTSVTTAQADAPLPKGDTDKVSLGWIEVPPSFTAGTTATSTSNAALGKLVKMPYTS